MRSYLALLRLLYQLQLGPIFAWGFLLAGGQWSGPKQVGLSMWIFFLYHVCAFGGLTALNSFYDRDTTPVGGLWEPPAPPRNLGFFAWAVQLCGLALLFPFGWAVCIPYLLIVLLSLGYSHPRTRWKGKPFSSLAVVVLGQGALDFLAGVLAWHSISRTPFVVEPGLILGMSGAMFIVAAMYPLTQLYQLAEDRKRGDITLAGWLQSTAPPATDKRSRVFFWAIYCLSAGAVCNVVAATFELGLIDRSIQVGIAFLALLIWQWQQQPPTQRNDFNQVHGLMRIMAVGFGGYIVARLLFPA